MIVALDRIEQLPSGCVALTLRADPHGYASMIYRAGAEITWEADGRRFISPRPELGPPRRHFAYVAAAAKQELGYELVPDDGTEWINVSPAEREAMEQYSNGGS